MAEMDWTTPTQPVTSPTEMPLSRRLAERFFDWEDWLTLLMLLGAVLSVSAALEGAGWREEMPPITLLSFAAVLVSLLLARSRLSAFLAWPLAVLLGVLMVFWQTLEIVGPGDLEQRLDAIYFRFNTWFDVAFSDRVTNDPLPTNVLILGLTWLGVFLFGWSVYRWNNAWLGLIPGGIALFMDMAFVGDSLTGAVLLYMLFSFLLVMRTNLMARMVKWRAEGTSYPPLISFTFLNFGAWVLLALITASWIAPVGPFSAPAGFETLGGGFEKIGVNFIRLAGPLHVKKVVPVHNYTAVLPFQGSVSLGDRELLTVTVDDPTIQGPIRLRGAVYDEYATGGWKAGERRDIDLPGYTEEQLKEEVESGKVKGQIIPITVKVERKSVVGTVLFSPGDAITASVEFAVEAPAGGVSSYSLALRDGGRDLSDEEILSEYVPQQLGSDRIGLHVERDGDGRVTNIDVFEGSGQALPDALVVKPPSRLPEGTSYTISGFIPAVTPDELRAANRSYPAWIEQQYLQLPDTLPDRVRDLAQDVAGYSAVQPLRAELRFGLCRQARCGPGDNVILTRVEGNAEAGKAAYDAAKAIEDYLRGFPLDYGVEDTPPGEDTVDYFLFQSGRGYFDYHASAMVVMLRTLGIPSRLAVGFVIDESDIKDGGEYSVEDRDAYAWPEVYFPGYGWIAFNPSPDRPEDLMPTVLNEETQVQPEVAGPPDLPLNEDDPIFDIPGESGDTGAIPSVGTNDKYDPLLTLAVFSFVAMLAAAVALGWQRSVSGLPYTQQLWEKTVRLATWGGHPPQPGQTPAEFARRLERVFYSDNSFSELAAVYNRSRFGRREVDGEERERLRQLWPQLRGELLAAIPKRFLRRRRSRD